ncbi:unnamed protein product [Choristocarpus tenellus]
MAEQLLREGPVRNSGLNRYSVLGDDQEEKGEDNTATSFDIQTYMDRQLVYAKKIVDEAMEGIPHDQGLVAAAMQTLNMKMSNSSPDSTNPSVSDHPHGISLVVKYPSHKDLPPMRFWDVQEEGCTPVSNFGKLLMIFKNRVDAIAMVKDNLLKQITSLHANKYLGICVCVFFNTKFLEVPVLTRQVFNPSTKRSM